MKVIKSIVVIIYLLCFLLIINSSSVSAFSNEPNGFRNLYWGETLQEIKDSGYNVQYGSYYSLENSVSYNMPLPNTRLGSVSLLNSKLYLSLWNNQLYKVVIVEKCFDRTDMNLRYDMLKNSMINHFGYFTHETPGMSYSWTGDTTKIHLMKTTLGKENNIFITIESIDLLTKAKKDADAQGW